MSRRNSKVYDQPIVDAIGPDGIPSVRVDDSSESDRHSSRAGILLGASSSPLGAALAKSGIAILVLVATVSRLLGGSYLTVASQLFGFTLIFVLAFFLCCGLFVWWGVWGRERVGLTLKKVLIVYGICSASDLISLLLDQYIDLGPLDQLPVNMSLYAIMGISLLSLFSICVHDNGVAAIFSNESSLFVGLVLLLHFCMASLFHYTLPPLIHGQLVHTSCFLGLGLALTLKEVRLGGFRLSRLRQMVWGSQTKRGLKIPSHFGQRRKISNIGDLPSNHHQKNSVSSQSSITSSLPASVSTLYMCVLV